MNTKPLTKTELLLASELLELAGDQCVSRGANYVDERLAQKLTPDEWATESVTDTQP